MKKLRLFLSLGLLCFLAVACDTSSKNEDPAAASISVNQNEMEIPLQDSSEFPPSPALFETNESDRTIQASWNLVSFPTTVQRTIGSVLSTDQLEKIKSIWSWDTSLNQWRVYPKRENFPQLTHVEPAKGYWIYSSSSFELTGTGATSTNFDFEEGWNLIGYSHSGNSNQSSSTFATQHFSNSLCNNTSLLHSFWGWENDQWKLYFPEDTISAPTLLNQFNQKMGTNFQILNTIQPGMGLWAKAKHGKSVSSSSDCPDTHGDDFESAFPIALGSTTSAQINQIGDVDYLSFSVSTPGDYLLTTTGTADTVGALFDSNQQVLAGTDDIGDQKNFSLAHTLAAGNYFLRVQGYFGTTGSYQVSVSRITDDHGDSFGTASNLSIGSLTSGNIGKPGDNDFFRIVVSSSGTYSGKSIGALNTKGTLYSSSGTELQSRTSGGGNENFLIRVYLSAGTYYLKVEGENGNFGDYQLLMESPQTLSIGSSRSAYIASGETDQYQFTVSQSGTYQIYSSSSFETIGHLATSSGAVTLGSNRGAYDGNDFKIIRDLQAGTYLVSIEGNDPNDYGSYSIYVGSTSIAGDDFGNSTNNAQPLTVGNWKEGNISTSGDVDVFSFYISTAGHYWVLAGDYDSNQYANNVNGVLVDSQGQVVDLDIDANRNFYTWGHLSVGTYYYYIFEEKNETGPYWTIVDKDFNDAHGSSYNAPSNLSIGSSISAAIDSVWDWDYFKITVSSAGMYHFYTTGSVNTWADFRTGDGNQQLAYDNDSGDGENALIRTYLEPGSYFLRVAGWRNENTGSYRLYANRIYDDHSDTESISGASPLYLNSSKSGSIQIPYDRDVFQFRVSTPGYYRIQSQGTDFEGNGRLLDNQGNQLAENYQSGSGKNFMINKYLEAGIYLVTVWLGGDNTGDYSLLLSNFSTTDDHGDSISSASSLPIGSSISGEIQYSGDLDFFRLTIPSGSEGFYTIKTTGDLDSYGILRDSTGRIMASDDDEESGVLQNFLMFQGLDVGTYYIQVRGFDSDVTGSYQIQASRSTFTDDHGNNTGSATAINLESTVSGSLQLGGEYDMFRFSIFQTGFYQMASSGSTDVSARLLDNTGKLLTFDDNSGSGTNFMIQMELDSGTYYLSVGSSDRAVTGSYQWYITSTINNPKNYVVKNLKTAHGFQINPAGDFPVHLSESVPFELPEDTVSLLLLGSGPDWRSTTRFSRLETPTGADVIGGRFFENSYQILLPYTGRESAYGGTWRYQLGSNTNIAQDSAVQLVLRTGEVSETPVLRVQPYLTGTSFTTSQINSIMTQLKAIFAKNGITVLTESPIRITGTEYAVLDRNDDDQVEKLRLNGRADRINLFFVQDLTSDSGSILGFSPLPATLGISGVNNGAIVGLAVQSSDSNVPEVTGLAQTAAHEMGHTLGLFHPTERSGENFDPLPDTPECPALLDEANGEVNPRECIGFGAQNLMFWQSTNDKSGNHLEQTQLTPDQIHVIRYSPLAE